MKYEIYYVAGGRDQVAKTFAEALAKIRRRFMRTYSSGWRIENAYDDHSDEAIERDFDGCEGDRTWAIYRNINIANCKREYAYITERDDED